MFKLINNFLDKIFYGEIKNFYKYFPEIALVLFIAIIIKFLHIQKYNDLIILFNGRKFEIFVTILDFILLGFVVFALILSCITFISIISWAFIKLFLKLIKTYTNLEEKNILNIKNLLERIMYGCYFTSFDASLWIIVLFSILYLLAPEKSNFYLNYINDFIKLNTNNKDINFLFLISELVFFISIIRTLYKLLQGVFIKYFYLN